jgi:hypothetical protein
MMWLAIVKQVPYLELFLRGLIALVLVGVPLDRGIHSLTFQLNLSVVNGIWGVRRDCVARVKGVSGGVYGV